MRGVFFAFVLFIYTGIALNTQYKAIEYLESGDIDGFIKSCNRNEETAIDSLIDLSLNDTITSKQIWYNETEAKGINPFERSFEGPDKFYTSIKLKSYYWILQIFYSKYNCMDKGLCVFISNDYDFIFDYEIVDQEKKKQALKEMLTGKSENQKIVFQYKKSSNTALDKLDHYFQNWYTIMKEKGLDYMRKHNIPPIREYQYKISKL